MMRLIDSDKLKKHYAWWEDDRQELFDSIVDQQQTVDAVPVIRCKDCKHLTSGKYGIRCEYIGAYTEEDNYCKWAERRTDETD